MSIRKILLASVVIAGISTMPASARVDVDLDLGLAPPPAQVEVVPAPREGYTWAPGYWYYEGGQHVWRGGRWVENRPGYVYAPEHWEHNGDKWHFAHGDWHAER